jgi:hypothetical protein
MAVGIAAIPAGVLYAFLVWRGYESRWTALLAIVLGCLCARLAWKMVDRKFKVQVKRAPDRAVADFLAAQIRPNAATTAIVYYGYKLTRAEREFIIYQMKALSRPNYENDLNTEGLDQSQDSLTDQLNSQKAYV